MLLERVTALTRVPEWTKCSSREKRKEKKVEKPFYSDSEGESGPTESADSDSDTGSGTGSGSEESGSESGSEESEGESESDKEEEEEKHKRKSKSRAKKSTQESEGSEPSSGDERKKPPKGKGSKAASDSESEEEEEEEESSSESSESESEGESESDTDTRIKQKTCASKPPPRQPKKETEMSLLDLDDFEPTPSPQVTPVNNFVSSSLVTDLEGLSLSDSALSPAAVSPASGPLKSYELLHRITGEGLSVSYCFSRRPFSHDPHMVSVQMQFTNSGETEARNLHIQEPKLQSGMRIAEFPEIDVLPPGETVTVVMGIDFSDSTQAANFQLCTHTRKFFLTIQPPVGELMMPVFMTENEFKKEQGQLTGMNEITEKLTLGETCQGDAAIVQRVTSTASLSRVPCGSEMECRFAGKTVTSGSLVLVTIVTREQHVAQLTVNCEKMLIGTMLVKDILQALSQ